MNLRDDWMRKLRVGPGILPVVYGPTEDRRTFGVWQGNLCVATYLRTLAAARKVALEYVRDLKSGKRKPHDEDA